MIVKKIHKCIKCNKDFYEEYSHCGNCREWLIKKLFEIRKNREDYKEINKYYGYFGIKNESNSRFA